MAFKLLQVAEGHRVDAAERPRRRRLRGWSADYVADEAEEGRRLISLNPQLLTIALRRTLTFRIAHTAPFAAF
jgi:hypothetical protein